MKELSLRMEPSINAFLYVCLDAVCIKERLEAQHSGNKQERTEWSRDRYMLSPSFKRHIKELPGLHVILIDDIITTGATLTAIKNILSNDGIKNISCFALCFTKLASPQS